MPKSVRRVTVAAGRSLRSGWRQDAYALHDLVAGRTAHFALVGVLNGRLARRLRLRTSVTQQLPRSLQHHTLAAAEETVVAYLAEALGQDVLQEALPSMNSSVLTVRVFF
jgi:hypothetical protein